MKKLVASLIIVLFGAVGLAQADTYWDIKDKKVWFDKDYKVHKWVFNLDEDKLFENFDFKTLTGSGVADINPEDTILSAHLFFNFFDSKNQRAKSRAKIVVKGSMTAKKKFRVNNDWKYFGDVTSFLDNHILTVKIKRRKGSFGVSLAGLGGEYIDNPVNAPVPEPATMLLLGAGLVGVIGLNRKRLSK